MRKRIMLIAGVIILFIIILLFPSKFPIINTILYPKSTARMYLPWNKERAVKIATEYYNQHYTKNITYSHIDVFADTETIKPIYWYNVYFYLTEEPECIFDISLDYRFATDQCYVVHEEYLCDAMKGRMIKDIDKNLQEIYGDGFKAIFNFRKEVVQNEKTTLQDVKQQDKFPLKLYVNLYDHHLKVDNIYEEAEKLFQCYVMAREKGYLLMDVTYNDTKSISNYISIKPTPEMNSIEDAEIIVKQAFNKKFKND